MKKIPLIFFFLGCFSVPLTGMATILCPSEVNCDSSQHCNFSNDGGGSWAMSDTKNSAEGKFAFVNASSENNSDIVWCTYRNSTMYTKYVTIKSTIPVVPDEKARFNKWMEPKNESTLYCPSYHVGLEPRPPFDCPIKKIT